MRMTFQAVVDLGCAAAQKLVEVRCERMRRQLQPSFGFGALAHDDGARVAGDLQHRRVFAQGMDEDGDDAAIARMKHGVLEQAAAEAAYRTALAIDPAFADASLNLGALLCEARRYGEAVALYDDAVRLNPGEALLHFNRAIALEDSGRLEAALASYNTSLQLAPDLADAHFNAARLHEQLGDAKKAVRHLSAYRRLQRR